MTSPLERLAQRLGTADGRPRLVVGPPSGSGWWTLADATAGIEDWFAPVAGAHGDRRVGAAYVSAWLAGAPALVVGLSAILGEVVARTDADRLWVHRHADGWVDQYAVEPLDVAAGPVDEVLATAGAQLAELAAPVVDRACRRLPIGPNAVWGGVADTLTACALMLSRQAGRDQDEDWRRCDRLLDGLQEHAPLRVRPSRFPVDWTGGRWLYPVRGTCCLYYRTCDPGTAPVDRYCTTCPLRDDDSRTRRLVTHLESTAPGR